MCVCVYTVPYCQPFSCFFFSYHKFACFLQQSGMEIISILAPLPEKNSAQHPAQNLDFLLSRISDFFELLV